MKIILMAAFGAMLAIMRMRTSVERMNAVSEAVKADDMRFNNFMTNQQVKLSKLRKKMLTRKGD